MAFCNFLMIKCNTSDPGMMPKMKSSKIKTRIILNGNQTHLVELKFCATCCIMKPPGCSPTSDHRTVHCSVCDSCILEFDHHCPWLSTCIGKHNFQSFALLLPVLMILITLNITAILTSTLTQLMKWVFTVYLCPFLIGVSYLAWYNWTKVIMVNQSTYESIK